MSESNRSREILKSFGTSLVVALVTLVALEVVLRVADFRELRETLTERSLAYDYDRELGWMPQPGSASTIETFRTTHYRHNSLGLRDEEFKLDAKPTIMFLGDSFVWGLDSEAEERFSDLLKPRIPDFKILAAGVSGYGTDQEYLLLQKLWPKVKPAVVVLIFCGDNDRLDNMTSHRYDHYQKPYFATQPDGSLVLRGQPVPRSHLLYYRDDWLVRNLWLARLATNIYLRLAHPKADVPDPTEKIIARIRQFVESNGARLMVAIQSTVDDQSLLPFLQANRIPFVKLEGADYIKEKKGWGPHWTPAGQKDVADRIFAMLAENGVIAAKKN
ncbi:MAG: SGNH/GDSL hydrolase family protein [Xanthobacteraceae bacterium]